MFTKDDLHKCISNYKKSIKKLYKESSRYLKSNAQYADSLKDYDIHNFRISELVTHPSSNNQDEKGYLKEVKSQLGRICGKDDTFQGSKRITLLIINLINYISKNTSNEKRKRQLNKEKYDLHIDNTNTYVLVLIQSLFDEASSKVKYINQNLNLDISTPSVNDLINEPHSKYSRFQHLRFDYLRYKRGQHGESLVKSKTHFEDINTNKILTDINLKNDYNNSSSNDEDKNNQMDEIIINTKGIFIPEIKFYNAKFIVLYPNGHLIAKYSNGSVKDFGNIVCQLTKHENTIRKFLNTEFSNKYDEVNICSFIVCANDKVNSKSLCENTHIYYTNTFYHSLIDNYLKFPSSKELNRKDIANISRAIDNNKQEDRRFNDKLVFSAYFIVKLTALLIYIQTILKLNKYAYGAFKGQYDKSTDNFSNSSDNVPKFNNNDLPF